MYTLLVVLFLIVAIAMCGIVLIQESKGGGLASSFAASNQIMGVRKTTDVIEKLTWGLALTMVLLSIFCAYSVPTARTTQSVVERTAIENNATNPNTVPGFGASQTKQNTAAPEAKPAQNAPATDAAAPAEPVKK